METKVVWVTGASSGIGKAIAKQLVLDGYIVYASARRAEKMDDLKALGANILPLDVTDEKRAQDCYAKIAKTHGGVDVLVNNAGFALTGAVEDVPIDQARAEFDVNVFGASRLTALCLPYMRKKRCGRIISISSIGGKIFSPMTGWYFASKHAIEALSKCLRLEVRPFGIDVVVIRPGLIASELSDKTIDALESISYGGAYADLSARVTRLMNGYKPLESDPMVVAKAVSRAIRVKRPKQAYAVGRFAKLSLFAFWLIPERWMTGVMNGFSKKKKGDG